MLWVQGIIPAVLDGGRFKRRHERRGLDTEKGGGEERNAFKFCTNGMDSWYSIGRPAPFVEVTRGYIYRETQAVRSVPGRKCCRLNHIDLWRLLLQFTGLLPREMEAVATDGPSTWRFRILWSNRSGAQGRLNRIRADSKMPSSRELHQF